MSEITSIEFSGKRVDNDSLAYGDLIQTVDGRYFISLTAEASNQYGDGMDLYSTEFYEVHGYSIRIHVGEQVVNEE